MKILSIDAWKEYNGWTWNNWFSVGSITKKDFESLKNNRQILKYFRDEGYLNEGSQGLCGVYDDQYNIVITDRANNRPLFAIEYGPEY